LSAGDLPLLLREDRSSDCQGEQRGDQDRTARARFHGWLRWNAKVPQALFQGLCSLWFRGVTPLVVARDTCMRLLTRVAGKDAKVVLVPGNRESVPRVRCALLCNAAPAPSLHRNTTYRSHFRFIGTHTAPGSAIGALPPAVHAQIRLQIGRVLQNRRTPPSRPRVKS